MTVEGSMRMFGRAIAAGALLIAAGAIDLAGGQRHATAVIVSQESDEFRWSWQMAAGKTLEIKGVNGDVRAEAASGGQAEVIARKTGRRDEPADVRIEVLEHDDGVTICAIYPSRPGKEPNACGPGRSGRVGSHDHDVRVAFTVRVPAGVDFVGRTVNGEVEATSIEGNVDVSTVNGDVRATAAGFVEANTVNGSIRVSMGRGWDRPIELNTVNGGITVELPEGVSADVEASTVNGRIETDFPLTVRGRFGPRTVRGEIGGGGPGIFLETVNGSIALRRN